MRPSDVWLQRILAKQGEGVFDGVAVPKDALDALITSASDVVHSCGSDFCRYPDCGCFDELNQALGSPEDAK